jgi:Flp pilus assembly protein TadB
MAAVEVIYLLAASLWIGVVVAALCIGVRMVVKFRARRRRMNRLLDLVWTPVRLCTGRPQRRGKRPARSR